MSRIFVLLCIILSTTYAEDAKAPAPPATPEQIASQAVQKILDAMDAHGEDVTATQNMKGVLQGLETDHEDAAMYLFNEHPELEDYRSLVVATRDAFRRCRANQEQRLATDPAYRKQVADQKAADQAEREKAAQKTTERQQVEQGYSLPADGAGDDPYFIYLCKLRDEAKLFQLPPQKRITEKEYFAFRESLRKDLTGKTIHLNFMMPIGWRLPNNGKVAFYHQYPDRRTGRVKFYDSDIRICIGCALLYDPAPEVFPLGTTGFKKLNLTATVGFQPCWDDLLSDQMYAYSEAVQGFAKAHPEQVYSLVLKVSGPVSFEEMPMNSFTNVYLDQAKLDAEPMLYDSQFKLIQIGTTIKPNPELAGGKQ
jgi:hypothetical protein